jgi:site-specific recombinase XerD
MDVVYLFHESGTIRIPFYGYDKDLFTKLINTRLGYWDPSHHQYVVKAEYGSNIAGVITDRPYVEVEKTPDAPIQINGFFRPARRDESVFTAVFANTINSGNFTDPVKIKSLPDMFSEVWREKLLAELHSRKYSSKTISAYIHYNRELCRNIQKPPEDISSDDIRSHLAYLNKSLDFSASSINLALSAFKFFYHNIMKRNIAAEQHRPRQDKRLPVVFSKAEIKALLTAEKNLKHRLLLMMVYSSGLRVSEVVTLKRKNLDPARNAVIITAGKGRNDRYTLLSTQVIHFLKEYYSCYSIDNWLFPSQTTGGHLSVRTAQKVFENALKKAGIPKDASIHSLRHTFATHLLETGIDIKYIQELLGHTSIRTTVRYTHVACRHSLSISSPLDTITEEPP